MLLVEMNSNELWAVPPILPLAHVEPACQLRGPLLSTQQSPYYVLQATCSGNTPCGRCEEDQVKISVPLQPIRS